MVKHVMTCDACGKDILVVGDDRTLYLKVLQFGAFTSGTVTLSRNHDFCSLKCLSVWSSMMADGAKKLENLTPPEKHGLLTLPNYPGIQRN